MAYDMTLADILEWAAAYDGPLFHALLCDPPYHLTSITDRFGGESAAPAQFGKDGAFQRASRGFMNATWDGGDIAFRPETWAALGKLLHPGAFGMAFAGTRGYHRMATAIEDAGFILHPVICWNFASGFPKATRLDTQIDRAAGVDPIVTGTKKHAPKWAAAEFGYREKDNGYNSRERESFDTTSGATPLAQAWQGHRYGMQALKPAIELICVFQKPYAGRPIDSITRTGAGAINVDGGRIGTDEIVSEQYEAYKGSAGIYNEYGSTLRHNGNGTSNPAGRWPANLLLSHVYLPVLRLSAIISLDTKEVIERYFDGYNRVHELRQRVSGISESLQIWPGEVLQPGVQERVSEDAHQGAKPPVWRSPHGSISTEDVRRSEAAMVDSVRAKPSGMEGRHVSECRVSPCCNQSDERCRSRVGMADGTEGQRICVGTSDRDGSQVGQAIDQTGNSTSPEWRQARQSPGEFDGHGDRPAFDGTSEDRTGVDPTTRRESPLEVFADDIPPGWFRYFEPTGIDLGCNGTCVPGCPVLALGAQSGESESKATERGSVNLGTFGGIVEELGGKNRDRIDNGVIRGVDDSGTAARFFFNGDYALDRLEQTDPLIYVPKASTGEREAGLYEFETDTINDGRQAVSDRPYLRNQTQRRNTHPTIKPISLARHLATLLLPPELYAPRRLLVPFAGAGSEMIGAMLAGWEDVQGIELEASHVEIARARIAFWQQLKYKLMNPDAPVKVSISRVPDGQSDMFEEIV